MNQTEKNQKNRWLSMTKEERAGWDRKQREALKRYRETMNRSLSGNP